MVKLSVVISIKNRSNLFKHTLRSYDKQTMNKKDFELIVVDDGSTEDLRTLLKEYNYGMKIKYIRIDSTKSEIPVWGLTPALTNNVGFKNSAGDVILICGPETLQKECNFDIAYEAAQKDISAFGLIWHSNIQFVNMLMKNPNMDRLSFDDMLKIPSSRVMNITQNTFYWFLLAVKKKHIFDIGGVDEEYLRGVCGEDDDFAARLRTSGIENVHEFRMIGIHLDHSQEDNYDPKRQRRTKLWEEGRMINTERWNNWHKHKTIIANTGKVWGNGDVITNIVNIND